MESQSETTQTVSALKLPILKIGDYHLWSMRMEQYLTHTDYALWEVIMNGDAPAIASASTEGPIPPKTAEQKLARKNELKAKRTLLLAIPNEHLLKSEGLDKTYDRFQKLISQLKIHGEVIFQEDTNLKLLRSLPLAWNNIALIMRNKSDLDTLSMDELYNNLKVYEAEIKSQSSSSSNSQNVAFVSSENTSSTNEAVNTAHEVSTATRAPRNQGNRNGDAPRRIIPVDTPTNALVVQDGIYGYQLGLESLEARIVVHQKNEAIYEEDIAFSKYDIKVNDRFKKVEGYHAVPPPYTGNYMPLRPDLSFAGLDDSVYKTNSSETISSVPRIESTASKSSKDSLEQPKDVRPSAPIIEEWESDNENTRKSVIEQHTYRQARNLRKSQSPRDNRRNWNGMMTQKLGNGFEFIKKACFVCGSFNHLIKDCDFHDKKIVEKPVLNNKGRVTGQREIRPVWNNAQRVNHQNKFTHPHPKMNFVPTVVVTKLGQVPVNVAKQSSPRAATSISNAMPVNTAAPKSKVNDALPKTYSNFKAHSPIRRTFNQKSAAKTNNLNEKVKTARVNNVTTARPKAVVSTAEGKRENAIKSSACWIWRPTGKVIDHISKDSRSYMPKRFNYVNPQGRLKHMTRNKSYLSDYQEIDGGSVAFAGSTKGGKITRKGKIRIGKLNFEDVYFVKELKFNLFSVSQMCDKKNSVLFTKTECLVLSPDFKLLDESQVLLKVPRQNNMYSFDLKNVVPLGGETLLEAYLQSFLKMTILVLLVRRERNTKPLVGDEAVHKELGDIMERASTTTSSLEAEQDNGSGPRCQDTILGDVDAQTRFETTSKQSYDPPISRGYTLGSGEDSLKLLELMEFCTKLSNMLHKNR
ncbi:hypothetical protein Tco_0487019 [Tanacetum coccineum]